MIGRHSNLISCNSQSFEYNKKQKDDSLPSKDLVKDDQSHRRRLHIKPLVERKQQSSSPLTSTSSSSSSSTSSSTQQRDGRNIDLMLRRRFIIISLLIMNSISFLVGYFSPRVLQQRLWTHVQRELSSMTNNFDNHLLLSDNMSSSSSLSLSHQQLTETVNNRIPINEGHNDITYKRDITTETKDNKEGTKCQNGGILFTEHLQVEILTEANKNNKAFFLKDKNYVSKALLGIISQSSFVFLSHYCHDHTLLSSSNVVVCLGLFTEGRVTLVSWPQEGYASIDFYEFGGSSSSLSSVSLLPLVPVVEDVLMTTIVPSSREEYEVVWSHDRCGSVSSPSRESFRFERGWDVRSDPVVGRRQQVASLRTKTHIIDIQDIHPSSPSSSLSPHRSISLNSKPPLPHSSAYHEALVHPALFVPDDPQRIAIASNGDAAILREVLKHFSVKHVSVLGMDDELMDVTRSYMTSSHDCGFLMMDNGRRIEQSCFDDARVDVVVNEGTEEWFVDRFRYSCGGDLNVDEWAYCQFNTTISSVVDDYDEEEQAQEWDSSSPPTSSFDVIILNYDLMNNIYENKRFLEAVYGALSPKGVVVFSLGKTPSHKDLDIIRRYDDLILLLEYLGFESLQIYEEAHANPRFPQSFLMAFKRWETRNNWFLNEAELTYHIHNRLINVTNVSHLLHYYDGPTMKRYQIPPKTWEHIFCTHRGFITDECANLRGFNRDLRNVRMSDFEVKISSLGENAGRGVFAGIDVPGNSLVMQEKASNKIHFGFKTVLCIEYYVGKVVEASELQTVHAFMDGYGFELNIWAEEEFFVDSGFLIFMNHGCNGTSNVQMLHAANPSNTSDPFFSEATFDFDNLPFREPMTYSSAHNVVIDRHIAQFSTMDVTSRDVGAGEELFSNYLLYTTNNGDKLVEEVMQLRAQCHGLDVGVIQKIDSGAV